MTFKQMIEEGACYEGLNFCRERGFNFDRIIEDAGEWRRNTEGYRALRRRRYSALLGLRASMYLAIPGTTEDFRQLQNFCCSLDLTKQKDWEAGVMATTLTMLSCGIEF